MLCCCMILRQDQNIIEIPGQDPCEIGAGGRIFFFFPGMYMGYMCACHVELFLQHFLVIFIQFFYRQQIRCLPVQFFYISANDGPGLYIWESYKLGSV